MGEISSSKALKQGRAVDKARPVKYKRQPVHEVYKSRRAETRMIYLIQQFFGWADWGLDLGCGAGPYFSYLRSKAEKVIGVDLSEALCRAANSRGYEVIVADARHLPFPARRFGWTWASEVVEHLPDLSVVDEIERVTGKRIVITMPNPLSPHYRRDPTHRLKYSVPGLVRWFGERGKGGEWSYVVRGLGFKEGVPLKQLRLLTLRLTWYLPTLSPTIGILGTRATGERLGIE